MIDNVRLYVLSTIRFVRFYLPLCRLRLRVLDHNECNVVIVIPGRSCLIYRRSVNTLDITFVIIINLIFLNPSSIAYIIWLGQAVEPVRYSALAGLAIDK
jgi:hypothetical protein